MQPECGDDFGLSRQIPIMTTDSVLAANIWASRVTEKNAAVHDNESAAIKFKIAKNIYYLFFYFD